MTADRVIHKDFRRKVTRELSRLRDLWVDMRRDGLGIESDDGTRSPEQEFLLAEAEWCFSLFARAHLAEVMGTTAWYKAVIVSQFPEFPDAADEEDDE